MKTGLKSITTLIGAGCACMMAAQAAVVATNLNIAAAGSYPGETVITTAQEYNGATFDINYTLGSIANGSNSFVYATAAVMGVGSDTDIANHYSTLEGDDGEGMSFTSLSISNFSAGASGLVLEDITDLAFVSFSVGASGHNPDGVTMSFTGFTNNTSSMSLTGLGLNYTVDLTARPNYPVAPSLATNLFVKPNSASGSNRWNVDGVGVSFVVSTGANEAPEADAQSLQTLPDTAVEITLSGSDFEGSNLTYAVNDSLLVGSLTGATNKWTYLPSPGFEGLDSFTFTVNDGSLDSDPATVSITVTNERPVATPQVVEALRNTPLAIALAGTDTDGPSNLTYNVVSGPTSGALSGTEPNLTYTPTNGFAGVDAFTFTVFDGLNASAEATVTINVLNNPPVADSKILFTLPDTAVAILLSGSDPEGSGLVFNVDTLPANGALTGTEPNLTYTPTNGFIGTDSFTYSAYDGETTGAVATVSISVSADGFNLSFEELGTALSGNTLNVGGIAADVVGVSTNLDYLYSVSFAGADLDGDAANDEVTFDVRVKAWTNGVTDLGFDDGSSNLSTNVASATVGTSNIAVNLANGNFTTLGNTMPDGSTLEFTIENVAVSLTDATKTGSAVSTGFNAVLLSEINNGNSHQTIFGEGTGLLGWMWSTPDQFPVSGIDVGAGPLYVSSGATTNATATRPFNWGVRELDFGIQVTVVSAAIPAVSIDVSGGDLVFAWEGGGTYDVLTNANLMFPNWGVAVPGASSPVTNAVGSEPVLFFKLD
ncbi:hypothetical protein PDESU_04030 [Pontiella desulfatans]|uniref:Tandem-95 repeat protein n=1 Tax=Pontiella desulfatans TaxID=2750659 RepID=A0A6C2U6L9_PONDE|nr:Ig-like domain-containing protein [Pontiella desulfatans]VGO15447.1 hypothetical protein PDESU_04030 [Pontiella desulfatans]